MTRYRISLPILLLLAALGAAAPDAARAQGSNLQPEWWFGGGIGPNFNFYSGSVQNLNAATSTIGPFTKGSGIGVFLAPLIEYRPDPVWGGTLFFGFDGRNGSFDDISVRDTSATLKTSMNYLSLEPSVRYTPFGSGLHFFLGPRIAFNLAKTFTYTVGSNVKSEDQWDNVRGTVLGGQVGAGYDIPVDLSGGGWQANLTPFFAAHFGQGPRSTESWSLSTVRAGIALKFGSMKGVESRIASEVAFTIRAPKIIPVERKVKETFPLRNYIFFETNWTSIPSRYVTLTRAEAAAFKEEQLLQPQPKDLTGRSRRQMTVYYNILNILGDRMRRSPSATITLLGSSDQGPAEGRKRAESVKQYLVDIFGIESSRIITQGAAKPPIPSAQPGGTRDLELVVPEDQRVEISSSTLALLEPVQIISLQEEPLDSDVLFSVQGAEGTLASWSVTVTDETGVSKRYGPFVADVERVPGKTILGDRMKGRYTVALDAETKDGQAIHKEEPMALVKSDEPEETPGYRFSILFEFDQSKTVATYERFLTGTVAPLIADGSSVIIHGHTDIVGEESHNLTLSRDRARETMNVLQEALARERRKGVKFDTYGFGADVRRAPFDNKLPEERFYNRTVIIDIVPE